MFDYETELKLDLIEKVKPALKSKVASVTDDQKIVFHTMLAWTTPWIFEGDIDPHMNCAIAHKVVLKYFDFIPSRCQECWKVVARPKTVEQLFQVSEVQHGSSRPSKAGIETRSTVHGLYGAYWYNNSLERGLECKEYVKEEMAKISPDIGVILKRGCTEFELKYGPSINWQMTDEMKEQEAYINENIVIDAFAGIRQSGLVRRHTRLDWIRYAYKNGDETYMKFTGGKLLYPPYIQYFSQEEADALQAG